MHVNRCNSEHTKCSILCFFLNFPLLFPWKPNTSNMAASGEPESSRGDSVVTEFATYEDFLDSQITPTDLYYLEVSWLFTETIQKLIFFACECASAKWRWGQVLRLVMIRTRVRVTSDASKNVFLSRRVY